MQGQAAAALAAGNLGELAKWTGAMTHYNPDVAVFAHMMAAGTDWKAEQHHADCEDHVRRMTASPCSRLGMEISFLLTWPHSKLWFLHGAACVWAGVFIKRV